MTQPPEYRFIVPWQQGRCTIQLLQQTITINHVYFNHRKSPYFSSRIGHRNFLAASFPTLLRQMTKFIHPPPRRNRRE